MMDSDEFDDGLVDEDLLGALDQETGQLKDFCVTTPPLNPDNGRAAPGVHGAAAATVSLE
jgi:hypothetical protein